MTFGFVRGINLGVLVLEAIGSRTPLISGRTLPTRYEPPTAPRLLPPTVPQFRTLDAEVDKFVGVLETRRKFGVSGRGLAVAVTDTGVNPVPHIPQIRARISARRKLASDHRLGRSLPVS